MYLPANFIPNIKSDEFHQSNAFDFAKEKLHPKIEF